MLFEFEYFVKIFLNFNKIVKDQNINIFIYFTYYHVLHYFGEQTTAFKIFFEYFIRIQTNAILLISLFVKIICLID